jgi:hypothetical protein
MTEYKIQPNTRRCAVTGRDLQPGERYFTAIREEGDHFLREDFSSEAWNGPPEGAFSFWTGHVPRPEDGHRLRFDDDMLLDCFLRLEGQTDPGRINFRYVLALLLMRRKRFKFEETVTENGVEVLCLHCVRTGAKYRVINPRLSDQEMGQVQDEVFQVLGWE